VETRRGTHRSSGYGLHDSDTGVPCGSNHEKHCFYTAWLLAIQEKQIRSTRDSCRRYLDHHTLHNAGIFIVKNPLYFFFVYHSLFSYYHVLLISERSVLRNWIYGRNLEVLHHHWQTHHSQDANVDSWCIRLQELLHHIRHVSSCLLLRVSWHYNLWYSEVRRRYRKVRKVYTVYKILRYIKYTCNII